MRGEKMQTQTASAGTNPTGPIDTPAYVFDAGRLQADAGIARAAADRAGARLLFAMKACALRQTLTHLSPMLDGFHASSLFEARLARVVPCEQDRVHFTSPAIAPAEVDELCALCDMISFNSLSQSDLCRQHFRPDTDQSLRVNPGDVADQGRTL